MTVGQWVLLAAILGALAFGLWRSRTNGRFTADEPTLPIADPTAPVVEEPAQRASRNLLAGTPYADHLGSRATLLQFSSAFCAPCRTTRRVLEQVSKSYDGVVHVEVDAEDNLDLVRQLKVLRTPTTLVLDARGSELSRAVGAPTMAQVSAVLDEIHAGESTL